MLESNTRQSTKPQERGSDINASRFPPLSSYSPALPTPIRISDASSGLIILRSEQASNTTLEYLATSISQDLTYLSDLSKVGYSYLKPMGLEKSMKQISEEEDHDDDPINFEGGDAFTAADEDEEVDNIVGNSVEELTHSLHLNNDTEADLDADIPNNDAYSLDFNTDSGGVDNDDDDDDDDSDGGAGIMRDDNAVINDAEAFMASEEYQDDHSISINCPTENDSNPPTAYVATDNVLLHSGPLTSTTATTETSASNQIRTGRAGREGDETATGDTSPQTPYMHSHDHADLQDSPCLRSPGLRIDVHANTTRSSDYDMTIE
ncbi:hypothetical protein KL918_002988 [Ogataea parapolymorpha]|uniref:Uncharacterized protein n=1 Tax=Ogataea parapolymorpha (strain ATCC 26012 / BCRC 20466 / JCM 22074 / NRRL Y-7560 / DL-1) TaxID=871575 RepID=W1Q9W4_OGAPD|nr:hypothetical protein HPODL_01709 [Ogataea parapolymorpha DL-1]ESW97615.1 hypothetical protein HPODL_01709 [Ogataea parapolymorpha DL-1]KAG7866793.1 hypothetical protein KL918_002988 [Ogataea parapolymorpha]KAG7871944.1 hypothetical protein KL916_003547 [Ogataea parapolymorpha]